jgi:hypothetical protein
MPSSTLTLTQTTETTIKSGDQLTAANGAILKFVSIGNDDSYPITARIISIPEGLYTPPGSRIGSHCLYTLSGERHGGRPEWRIVSVESTVERIDVADLPVGSEVRLRNGKTGTVERNDGSFIPLFIRVSPTDALWYKKDGACHDWGDNSRDIVEVTRRGPAPTPVVSLENVEVGDKLRTRGEGTLEVTDIVEEHGGGCIKAGGFWYFKTGKLNISQSGGYSEYDVLEVIKAPKPRFSFSENGGFVPGTLYENGEGAVFIYSRRTSASPHYNFFLRRLLPDGTISTQEETFSGDGRYYVFSPDERRDIVRRLGPAQVKLAS